MAYDSKSNQVILFGGRTNNQNNFSELFETWTLDVNTNAWTKVTSADSPQSVFEPLAYDAKADRTIYYAGIQGTYPEYAAVAETWAYDANAGAWTNLQSANTPLGYVDGGMAYDAKADKVILFGGFKNGNINQAINETWVFDYGTNSWKQMQPAASPPGMGWPALAYDSESDRVLVWGGWPSMSAKPTLQRTSLWAYDLTSNTWTEMPNSDGPVEDYMGVMVYDQDLDRSFLYVGFQFWSYDYNNNHWEKLKDVTAGPGRRTDHAMVYDSQNKYIILFGGIGSMNLPDNATWFYDTVSQTWAQAGP